MAPEEEAHLSNADGACPEPPRSNFEPRAVDGISQANSLTRGPADSDAKVTAVNGDEGFGGQGGLYSGQSVVEQVALTVPVGDDPSLPVFTFRMAFLAVLSCAALAFINQFFYYRQAPLVVSPYVAQVVTLYVGRFLHVAIPSSWTWLNPGPFNMKEHALITIAASTGALGTYAMDIVAITVNPAFYNSTMPFLAALIICVTTNILGYGWAGLYRRFLVDPAEMWWPNTLVKVALFRSMHEKEELQPGEWNRFSFFLTVAAISFVYYILPGYLFTILCSFAWVCFIWPDSIVAQQIGSGYSGLGFGALCFDWATATAFLGSPLALPWYVVVNNFLGFAIYMWVVQPFIYWFNVYNSRNFQFFGTGLFNLDGSPYNVTAVIDAQTLSLNETAFEIYGPPWLSGFFAVTYALAFACISATVVHVALWNGAEIWQLTKAAWANTKGHITDVHTRIMKHNYRDIPHWWWLVVDGCTISLAIVGVCVYKSVLQLPVWGLFLALVCCCALTLPIGVIAAATNQVIGLNVVAEMSMGAILPGKPIAVVLFKSYGYTSAVTAVGFLQDFKLGTYMKVPPRSMFAVQVSAGILTSVVTLLVAWWQLHSIVNICNLSLLPPDSPWTCPNTQVYFDASVVWGLIGTTRQFGPLGQYWALEWGWLVGAVLPVPFWLAFQYFPRQKWLRLVNMPVFLQATAYAPPAGTVNYTSWLIWGFIFSFYMYRYRKKWWARYNYLLSAGLDVGVAFMAVILFFAFQNRDVPLYLDWWGNQAECPIAQCPTTTSSSLAYNAAVGGGCPVWN